MAATSSSQQSRPGEGLGCFGRWEWEVWRYSVYTDIVDFKWDPRKAAGNLRKHGIDFHEAATVLDDTFSTTFPDTDHSTTMEARFLSIGMSNRGRILVVARGRAGWHDPDHYRQACNRARAKVL